MCLPTNTEDRMQRRAEEKGEEEREKGGGGRIQGSGPQMAKEQFRLTLLPSHPEKNQAHFISKPALQMPTCNHNAKPTRDAPLLVQPPNGTEKH